MRRAQRGTSCAATGTQRSRDSRANGGASELPIHINPATEMRNAVQLAQKVGRTRMGRTPSTAERAAETRTQHSNVVRPENPLGVPAARSVEARREAMRAPKGRGSPRWLGTASLTGRELATGAQENALQHLCASSVRRSSPDSRHDINPSGKT